MTSPTEALHVEAARLRPGDTRGLLALMAREDARALAEVAKLVPKVARLAEQVAAAIGAGGRLVYLGAGTSGRLGALDAAEIPPTFGASARTVVALLAGGKRALTRAVEGAEDDAPAGRRAVRAAKVGPRDVVVGISASGGARWVRAGLEEARRLGAITALVTCNPRAVRAVRCDAVLCARTGPEVLAGSTRLKAATATRAVLAMLSTGAFFRLGRTRGGRMVSLVATNQKLLTRAALTLARLKGISQAEARRRLLRAQGRLAVAIASPATGTRRSPARRSPRPPGA